MSQGDYVIGQVSTSNNDYMRALLNAGYRWNTSSQTGNANEIRMTFAGSGFTPGQANTVGIALGRWAAVSNIQIVEVVGETASDLSPRADAELLFGITNSSSIGGFGGYSGTPYQADRTTYETVNGDSILVADRGRTYTYIARDATLNGRNAFDGSGNFTNAGVMLVMHEIGHALGLKHPHDPGSSNFGFYFPGVTPGDASDFGDNSLNQNLYSIMSYNAATIGYESATPMAFDIAAIQTLYGARTGASSGNDTYTIPETGSASTWRCIWDTGGIDSIRYNGTADTIINLRPATLDNSATGGGSPSYSYRPDTFGSGFTIAGDITGAIADQNGVTGVIIENAYGGSGKDLLGGNDVDNILDGGAGADTMRGFGGSDTYYVDNTGDSVTEAAGGGTNDRVNTTLTSYTLGANVELLDYQGPNTTGFTGTGNGLDNTIQGYFGADTLDGKGGVDTLRGYTGNDTYYVDAGGDQVLEAANSGTLDRVFASVSYVLGAGQEVEVLGTTALLDRGAIDLTGNETAQTLVGNFGVNRLDGRGGADILYGYGGNDTFLVDDPGDRVIEDAGDGTDDRVFASASYALAAGQEVEVLATTRAVSTRVLDLTGNERVQTLYGNAGANILDGKGGADTLHGNGGNDSYLVDEAGDRVFEAAGGGSDDRVYASFSYALAAGQEIEVLATTRGSSTRPLDLTGNEAIQTLYGNQGANILDGRAGYDVLQGYGGADSFVFSTALGASNVDRIADFAAADDTIQLAKNIFTVLPSGALSQAAFKTLGAAGVDADDRILYDQGKGRLYYDADGSGSGAAVQFAILSNKAALAADDFLVV